ncbi:PA14 domain protein [compost metagenome]
MRFTGKLKVPVQGLTRFRLYSDDGSRLYINGQLVIDNDGVHSPSSVTAELTLNPGLHDIRVDYFQGPGSALALQLFWETAAYGTWYPIYPEVQVPPSAYGVPEAIAR